jgi:glycosyltransferase involved in cell wall biosynthesis
VEAQLVSRPAQVVALTGPDALRLEVLAGRPVGVVAAPFPAVLPAGAPLAGDLAVAVLVGSGWAPNREGAAWFLREVWPLVVASRATARLHLFGWEGAVGPSVEVHAPPTNPAQAFPEGGLVVVPLRVASGVRMKILEAWARGVPVVSTGVGAVGLAAPAAVRQGNDATALAAAILELAADSRERTKLVTAGRQALLQHHNPTTVAAQLVEHYRAAQRPCTSRPG